MAELSRHYCVRCETSIFNVRTDDVRVPIVFKITIGQPDDTGPKLDVNAPGVRLPSVTREAMQDHVFVKSFSLCNNCVSEVFGLPLLTAEEDPMYSQDQAEASMRSVRAAAEDAEVDELATRAISLERAILAIQVGRGAVPAPPLAPVRAKAIPLPPASAVTLEPAE
jgi:hypothetical protein